MAFLGDVFTHLFSWDTDPQRQEKIINARLEAEFDGIDTALSSLSATRREKLSAARTYYVRTDGNDSNTGLADTAGGAFLTKQKAVDVVAALDLAIYNVVIQLGSGTYAGALALKTIIGAGSVTIRGDTATPANVVISNAGISASNIVGNWIIEGLKFTTTGIALDISGPGTTLSYGSCDFGACTTAHIRVRSGAYVVCHANYSITGGTSYHWINSYSYLEVTVRTITISSTPAFTHFILTEGPSYSRMFGNTFSGSATGARFFSDEQGVIQTNGAGINYFPGNAAGTENNTCDTYR